VLDTTKDIHITTNIVDRTTFGPTLTTFEHNGTTFHIQTKSRQYNLGNKKS